MVEVYYSSIPKYRERWTNIFSNGVNDIYRIVEDIFSQLFLLTFRQNNQTEAENQTKAAALSSELQGQTAYHVNVARDKQEVKLAQL